MDMPVNFLPWRQTRRKATLRLWSMMFGGALVLISGVTLSRYAIGNIETRAEGVLLLAEQQLASALQASKPRLLQRQQMHQQAKRRQQELAATGNWQPALYALAEQLPEKAWFTKMAWQKDRLMLSGLAANIASLTALEQMLRSNASFLLIHKRGIIIGMSLLLLTGMRDPFRPPEDRCQIAELTQWHYRGMVGQGERVIAIISDSQHNWQRVEQRDVLENGWTILQITPEFLTLNTGKTCEPDQWQWQRQGEENEAMDSRNTDDGSSRRAGHETRKSDVSGG